MVKFVEHRVADRRILRLIQKWLKAGVSEDDEWSETTSATTDTMRSRATPIGSVSLGSVLRRLWRTTLSRRSQTAMLPWDRLKPIFDRWIPLPRVLHPYPHSRFAATHPRWEPYA